MKCIPVKGEHFWQTVPGTFYWSQTMESGGPGLLQFGNIDECINWLFTTGRRELARALNAKKHEGN